MTTVQATGPAAERRKHLLRKGINLTGQYALNLLLFFIFVFPLWWMIVSSFKGSNAQIFGDVRSLRAFLPVGEISLDAYVAVFQNSSFPRFLANSLVISIITVILSLFVNSMAAYALSRLKWPGQKLILAIIIATLIIPFEAVAVPLLMLVSKLPWYSFAEGGFVTGWLNSYHVQIIPGIVSAFSIFLFYQFFQDIPIELDEAALVDGASRFRIYWNVIVPNSGPVFATVTILTFLGAWNAFLWPIMTIQSEELRPVQVGLQYFFQRDTQWSQVLAYKTMITLPVLFVFLIFQGAFVRSIATSGLKG
jgi:multiple sugar transport system permease protein